MSTTRSGRKIKAPERWEPREDVTDDYKPDEYDTDGGGSCVSDISRSDEESEHDSDDDFIVKDEGSAADPTYEASSDESEPSDDDYEDEDESE